MKTTDELSEVVAEAVRYARVSIGRIADEAGYSRVTLDTYVNRRRAVSTQAALAIADALEARARRLEEHVQRIREVADEHPTDAPETAGDGEGGGDARDR